MASPGAVLSLQGLLLEETPVILWMDNVATNKIHKVAGNSACQEFETEATIISVAALDVEKLREAVMQQKHSERIIVVVDVSQWITASSLIKTNFKNNPEILMMGNVALRQLLVEPERSFRVGGTEYGLKTLLLSNTPVSFVADNEKKDDDGERRQEIVKHHQRVILENGGEISKKRSRGPKLLVVVPLRRDATSGGDSIQSYFSRITGWEQQQASFTKRVPVKGSKWLTTLNEMDFDENHLFDPVKDCDVGPLEGIPTFVVRDSHEGGDLQEAIDYLVNVGGAVLVSSLADALLVFFRSDDSAVIGLVKTDKKLAAKLVEGCVVVCPLDPIFAPGKSACGIGSWVRTIDEERAVFPECVNNKGVMGRPNWEGTRFYVPAENFDGREGVLGTIQEFGSARLVRTKIAADVVVTPDLVLIEGDEDERHLFQYRLRTTFCIMQGVHEGCNFTHSPFPLHGSDHASRSILAGLTIRAVFVSGEFDQRVILSVIPLLGGSVDLANEATAVESTSQVNELSPPLTKREDQGSQTKSAFVWDCQSMMAAGRCYKQKLCFAVIHVRLFEILSSSSRWRSISVQELREKFILECTPSPSSSSENTQSSGNEPVPPVVTLDDDDGEPAGDDCITATGEEETKKAPCSSSSKRIISSDSDEISLRMGEGSQRSGRLRKRRKPHAIITDDDDDASNVVDHSENMALRRIENVVRFATGHEYTETEQDPLICQLQLFRGELVSQLSSSSSSSSGSPETQTFDPARISSFLSLMRDVMNGLRLIPSLLLFVCGSLPPSAVYTSDGQLPDVNTGVYCVMEDSSVTDDSHTLISGIYNAGSDMDSACDWQMQLVLAIRDAFRQRLAIRSVATTIACGNNDDNLASVTLVAPTRKAKYALGLLYSTVCVHRSSATASATVVGFTITCAPLMLLLERIRHGGNFAIPLALSWPQAVIICDGVVQQGGATGGQQQEQGCGACGRLEQHLKTVGLQAVWKVCCRTYPAPITNCTDADVPLAIRAKSHENVELSSRVSDLPVNLPPLINPIPLAALSRPSSPEVASAAISEMMVLIQLKTAIELDESVGLRDFSQDLIVVCSSCSKSLPKHCHLFTIHATLEPEPELCSHCVKNPAMFVHIPQSARLLSSRPNDNLATAYTPTAAGESGPGERCFKHIIETAIAYSCSSIVALKSRRFLQVKDDVLRIFYNQLRARSLMINGHRVCFDSASEQVYVVTPNTRRFYICCHRGCYVSTTASSSATAESSSSRFCRKHDNPATVFSIKSI